MSTRHWYTSSSGSVELEIDLEDAKSGSHSGACDDDIDALLTVGYIAEQLALIDPAAIRDELREYGAWDEGELANDLHCRQRILWIACGDIVEQEASSAE